MASGDRSFPLDKFPEILGNAASPASPPPMTKKTPAARMAAPFLVPKKGKRCTILDCQLERGPRYDFSTDDTTDTAGSLAYLPDTDS
ncbi:hypothetical protein ACKVWC_009607 [Pyricularia oryzae]|nr:hypothetical protein MCOR09_006748 [Pyricularia oryzae]